MKYESAMRRVSERCCTPTKSLGRLACIFQSVLLGAGVIGTLGLLAFFPTARDQIAERYFSLKISEKGAHVTIYYGLASTILCWLPFNLVAILGTRNRWLIMSCMVSTAIFSLHIGGLHLLLKILVDCWIT